MTGQSGSILTAAAALFGPIVWATHFLVVYTSESLLCRSTAGQAHTQLLGAATILALLLILAHGVRQWRPFGVEALPQFVPRAALALDGLALAAIMFVAVAGLLLPACR